MKLQIASRLAVYAVLELAAHPDKQLSVGEIAAKYNVSSHHLAKVMNVLGRAGLVRSVRGAGGGHQFAGNPRRVTLLDIVSLFEDVAAADADLPGQATDEAKALQKILGEIDDITRATFGSLTISTMLGLIRQHRIQPVPFPSSGRREGVRAEGRTTAL